MLQFAELLDPLCQELIKSGAFIEIFLNQFAVLAQR